MKTTIETETDGSKTLVIRVEMQTVPTPSATGKSLIVATTHGVARTGLEVNGKPMSVNISAWIKAN